MEDDDDLDQDFLNMCGNIANNDEFMSNDELLYEFQTAADIVAEPPVIPTVINVLRVVFFGLIYVMKEGIGVIYLFILFGSIF
ncbi:hypothetical protein SOVF_085760 [Spinacia oleracea]|nr:hypothetical protein SOVF_085760 [Spinacia oleracea]